GVVDPAAERGLECPGAGREVRGGGDARHVGGAQRVDGDPRLAEVGAAPAEVGGVGEARAGGVELRDEGVPASLVKSLEGAAAGGEVSGVRGPLYEGVAQAV